MKKVLKIISMILIVLVILAGLLFYFGKQKMERNRLAQKNADYIIDNLNKMEVLKEFPEASFKDRQQLEHLVSEISRNCEWNKRDGKFVDFCTMKEIGGINATAFIYEYYLKCDSLRFILTYNVDKDKPELFKMDIEGLEKENSLIIFPEKQLKYRK